MDDPGDGRQDPAANRNRLDPGERPCVRRDHRLRDRGMGRLQAVLVWEATAVVSGIVGLVAVVPFIVGQSQLDIGFGDLGVQINLWMHIVGSAALIAIVLLPTAHDWVTQRL
jgi:hypothetical protein